MLLQNFPQATPASSTDPHLTYSSVPCVSCKPLVDSSGSSADSSSIFLARQLHGWCFVLLSGDAQCLFVFFFFFARLNSKAKSALTLNLTPNLSQEYRETLLHWPPGGPRGRVWRGNK